MDLNEAVGLQVKQLRKALGMTQLQLAFEAGLSLEHIGQVERGGTSPSVKNVAKIAAGLGVPVAQLFALHEADATHGPSTPLTELMRYLAQKRPEEVAMALSVVRQMLER